MLTRDTFDKLFTEKFFLVAQSKPTSVDLPRPTDKKTLKEFLLSFAGQQYQAKMRHAIQRLKKWCEAQGLPAGNVDTFNEKFPYLNSEYAVETAYELHKDGAALFLEIVDVLEKESRPLEACKTIVRNLLSELSMCPPGAYKGIYTAHLKLMADAGHVLMDVRKEILEQVVEGLIHTYNKHMKSQPNPEFFVVLDGNNMHYVNKINDLYAAVLGLAPMNDALVPKDNIHAVTCIKPKFQEIIPTYLTPTKVIEQLIITNTFMEYSDTIARETDLMKIQGQGEAFTSSLDTFGIDELFNINNLYDQSELADDKYVVSSEMEYQLWVTLLFRLANSGYFNKAAAKKFSFENDTIIYFPGNTIKLAHTIKNGQRKPFVTYCIDMLSADKSEFLRPFIHQLDEIQQELTSILFHPHTPIERMKEIIKCFLVLQSITKTQSPIIPSADLTSLFALAEFRERIPTLGVLTKFLSMVDPEKRLVALSEFDFELKSMLIRAKEPIDLLMCLPEEDLFPCLMMAKERGWLRHLIPDQAAFFRALTLLNAKHYYYFLKKMIIPEHMESLKLDIEAMILFLNKLKPEQAAEFLKIYGQEFWRELVKDAHQLGKLLTGLPSTLHHQLIALIGIDYLRVIVPDINNLIEVIQPLTMIQRMTFIEILSTTQAETADRSLLQSIITDWDKGGVVLAMLEPYCYSVFLNCLTNNINSVLCNAHLLFQAMEHLTVDNRILFLQQLGAVTVQQLIRNNSDMATLFGMIDAAYFSTVFTLIGIFHLQRCLPDAATLKVFVNKMPETLQPALLTGLAQMFTDERLNVYKADSAIYKKLVEAKANKDIPSARVSDFPGTLFNSGMSSVPVERARTDVRPQATR